MRILFCTDTYPPQVNGVSVVTELSVRGLRERGWDCEVVAPRYPRALRNVFSGSLAGVTSIPSLPAPIYPDIRLSWPSFATVERVTTRFQPHLIHSATEFIIGRLGARTARRRGIPFTTSYHTDFAKYTAAYGVPWLYGTISRAIARFHAPALRVFTPSSPSRDHLVSLGIARAMVWGRGVELRQFDPSQRSSELRQRLSMEGAYTFLHVGRLAAEKGVERLLEAFARVAAEHPQGAVRFIVAGDGPSLPSLRARAHPAVTFLGNLDRATELPALYASADAFLFASLTETLGLVVLEAMASGLPVIATPAGGVADHLRDGENGLAFAAGDASACADAMRRLLGSPSLQAHLRSGARRTAEGLSWDAELDRLDATYRELLEASAAKAPRGA